jgi:hypothetical protein
VVGGGKRQLLAAFSNCDRFCRAADQTFLRATLLVALGASKAWPYLRQGASEDRPTIIN